jgi:hypothetical protein
MCNALKKFVFSSCSAEVEAQSLSLDCQVKDCTARISQIPISIKWSKFFGGNMALNSFNMKLLKLSVLALALQVWLTQGQLDTSGLSCPAGYFVVHNYESPGWFRSVDPCYIDNPCGSGKDARS